MTVGFEDWFASLISDERWYELLRHYKDSTIKDMSYRVYAQLVADETTDVRPMKENRKHVYNILIKSGTGDKPKPKPFKVIEAEKKEAEQKAKEEPPLTGEARAKKLAEVKALIDSMPKKWTPPEMSEEEKEREGVLRKKHEPFIRSEVETMEVYNQHKMKIDEARRKYFLSAYPDASQEEIQAYIRKFDKI